MSEDEELSPSSEEEVHETGYRKPKRAKLRRLKKKLNTEESLDETILELEVAQDCLTSSDVLFRVYQLKKPQCFRTAYWK